MKTSRKLMMMAKIKKKSDEKKKPMTVEGSAAKPRLDRPMRMKRADGGPTISKDSKEEATRLERTGLLGNLAGGALAGLGGATLVGKGASRFITALPAIGASVPLLSGGSKRYREAERIRKGQATEGREDGDEVKRKRGGKVGK